MQFPKKKRYHKHYSSVNVYTCISRDTDVEAISGKLTETRFSVSFDANKRLQIK